MKANMTHTKTAIAAALILAAALANAADANVGAITEAGFTVSGSIPRSGRNVSIVPFTDTYTFTSYGGGVGGAILASASGRARIGMYPVTLACSCLSEPLFGTHTGFQWTSLPAGTYTLTVKGYTYGTFGVARYVGNVHATP